MCRERPSPSKAVVEGKPGPTARRPHSGRAPLRCGKDCAAGQVEFGGLSDQTVGAGAHIDDFLRDFS